MGGTSTDVAPIVGGEAQTTTDAVVAGVPIRHPTIDVHTVSAGGGSIARADAGGALRVGPRSAGRRARAGVLRPRRRGADGDRRRTCSSACSPTARSWAARSCSARGRPSARSPRSASRSGSTPQATALGVVRVADAEMVRALRVVSVERGLDPRDFALAAFGGAGGMHACALAEELGMATVLVPRASGVLSALGLAISDLRRDFVRPLIGALDALEPGALADALRRAGGGGGRRAGGRRADAAAPTCATAARRSS